MGHLPVAAGILVAALAGGCEGETRGHPPTARLALSPEFVPEGDGYRTDVVLDGSGSRDEIDDPGQQVPLGYRWEIDDAALRVVAGALGEARVTVRVAGARPTEVRLVVTDVTGASATSMARIGVTVPWDGGS